MKTFLKYRGLVGAAIILFFFLPFFSISCGDVDIVTVNGIQMVVGGEVKMADDFMGMKESLSETDGTEVTEEEKDQETDKMDIEPFAVGAFILALLGILFGFMKSKSMDVALIVCGALGIVFLFLLRNQIGGDEDLSDAGGYIKIKNKQDLFYR